MNPPPLAMLSSTSNLNSNQNYSPAPVNTNENYLPASANNQYVQNPNPNANAMQNYSSAPVNTNQNYSPAPVNTNQNYLQASGNNQYIQIPNPNANLPPFIPRPYFNNNGNSIMLPLSFSGNALAHSDFSPSSGSFPFTPQKNPSSQNQNNPNSQSTNDTNNQTLHHPNFQNQNNPNSQNPNNPNAQTLNYPNTPYPNNLATQNHDNPNSSILHTLNMEETIGVFKDLISHAESTLKQIANLVNLNSTSDCSGEFSACPFDCRHRMPPEHLFRHSLSCPASPAMVDVEILSRLRYPKTLKWEKDLIAHETPLFSDMSSCNSEDLCISIEEEEGFSDSDFFYKDALGVVNSFQREIRKTFELPRILSKECAENENINGNVSLSVICDMTGVVLLPSEYWSLRREVEGWTDFPSRYSFIALEAAMGLGRFKEYEIVKWVLLNSPTYGIIIDLPMAQHIVLLLKLCLRAILRETNGIYQREKEKKSLSDENKRDIGKLIYSINTESISQTDYFDCPVLLESAAWLALQMSILYGQACGRGLVIGMLRHSFLCAGNAVSCLTVHNEQQISKLLEHSSEVLSSVGESDGKVNVNVNSDDSGKIYSSTEKDLFKFSCDMSSEVGHRDKFEQKDGLISESRVFVSQVAAAVSALQERFFLEERIRGLRHTRRLSKFQLLAEHDNAVKKAVAEREKRLDYKPILEHDGLVWQRSSYQNSNKHKTMEELLAERRDYRRRRMSYRGKKVKRTPSQVLHDIIEGHMEEIELAGGIGCFVKGASETQQIATESIPSDGVARSMQQFGSTDSFFSNKGDGLSFRSKSGKMDMDLERTRFGKSRSSHMPSHKFSDDHNKLNKHEHQTRNDYAQDDDIDKHYRDNMLHDDVSHYSGSPLDKRLVQGYETRYDSRSHDRKPDSFLSNRSDRLSLRNNSGNMDSDLERTGFNKSRSSHMPSHGHLDDLNKMDKCDDNAQDDDKAKHYSANMFRDDGVSHHSGATLDKRFVQGYETRYDSRSHDRKHNSVFSDKRDILSFKSNSDRMDPERMGFSKSRSSHMPSHSSSDDCDRMDKHEHQKRNDHAQNNDNDKHYSANLFHDEDAHHYSGSALDKRFLDGCETRYDSRSHDRKPESHLHKERNSRRSHHRSESRYRSESRQRSRSQERKQKGVDGKYEKNSSTDRY
ncbi:hypothetical protein SUGI_0572360 [Cryptomeria japonica]|uniref:U11/U12 small nuclear ribonucleoprotein 48 kDa protein n=1 Tax=Cryptomeria japonica TaxID=3369 RepID=UPI002408F12A|nr:U11/U12 small nuclear ribonucleoprotein 48 kDa protein [Cryptomeria japonica]GLJ28999.1 hypothetical protein SUGI_0572360 [Cryptomeria japonica]